MTELILTDTQLAEMKDKNPEVRLEANIDHYWSKISDDELIKEWSKIKRDYGESPQSSSEFMRGLFDYVINFRLPYVALQTSNNIATKA